MHAEISPGLGQALSAERVHRRLRQGAADGDGDQRSRRARSPSPTPAGARWPSMPVSFDTNAFGQILGTIELPLAGDRVAGRRASCSRDSPGMSAWSAARGFLSALRSSPATEPRSPRARRPPAPRRWEPPPQSAVGEVVVPQRPAEPWSSIRAGLSARRTRPEPAGWSWRSTHGLPGRPGGAARRRSRRGHAEQATGSRVMRPRASPSQASRCTRRSIRTSQRAAAAALGGQYGGVAVLDAGDGSVPSAGWHRLLGPAAAGLHLQADHDNGRARRRGRQARPTSSRSRPRPSVGGREVANAHNEACGGTLRRGVRRVLQQRLRARWGRSSARNAWSARPSSYGFNSPPSLFDDRALEAMDPPQSTHPRLDRQTTSTSA